MNRYHKQFEKRRVREYASIVEWPFHSSCRWVWSLSLLWWLLWFSCPNLYLFLSFSRCECAKEISSSVHAFLSHSLFPFSLVLSLWQKKCVFDFHFSITLDKTERVNSRNFESHPLFECFFCSMFWQGTENEPYYRKIVIMKKKENEWIYWCDLCGRENANTQRAHLECVITRL